MVAYHCFFEQSGTFKNEFKKLGYEAYDYDILNDFNETDYVMDLYKEINKGYEGKESIFDNIQSGGGTIIAFFPCTRFEDQVYMIFQGTQWQLQNKSEEYKLELDLKLHKELHDNYCLITKLVLICIRKKIPLIIENPYSQIHYLTRYWCLRPQVIDNDRTLRGDHYKKPTQYWFINREPSDNFIFEPLVVNEVKRVEDNRNTVERSLISKNYANRFIREFIL